MAFKKILRRKRKRFVEGNGHQHFFKADSGQYETAESNPFFSSSEDKIQTKLKVSQPGEPEEVEADRMAEKVTNGSVQRHSALQRASQKEDEKLSRVAKEDEEVHKKEDEEKLSKKEISEEEKINKKEKKEEVQKKTDDEKDLVAPKAQLQKQSASFVTLPIATKIHSTKGAGSSLPDGVANEMSGLFGYDFTGVRIHTGSESEKLNDQLQAQAFTHGSDIYFNSGKYAPQTIPGKKLLAHELTHTIQQTKYIQEDKQSNQFSIVRGLRSSPQIIQRDSLETPTVLGAAGSEDRVAVLRFENEDGTWTAINVHGEMLYTGPLGAVVNPQLSVWTPALKKYMDPASIAPLSPIGPPESYNPEIYDIEMLRRKAAERKFDEYDHEEYGAHGIIYKRSGSGRIYANDIAAEDYKELADRYNINVSTDPYRVVLPTGVYAFESVYEGKLLKKIMEENKLPPEAIHQVAAQLEAEIESGAYQMLAGIGTARTGTLTSIALRPVRLRKTPGLFARSYLKLRLSSGLAGQGVTQGGGNPAIGAGGAAGRPVATLPQPAAATGMTAPAPNVQVNTPRPPEVASNSVAKPAAAVVSKNGPMRRAQAGVNRPGMSAVGKTLTPHMKSTPVVEVLPRATVPMRDFEPPEPGHYIRRKQPSEETKTKILQRAGRTSDGRLRDANTGRALEEGEAVWGHSPYYQFKEMRDMAEKLKWTQEEFDKFYEDPDKWQVEYGPSNSSRVFDRIPRQRPVQ